MEWAFNFARPSDACYVKVVIHKPDDRVVGFHIIAPNAGEITQGIGIAMKCNLTRERLESTLGIHPTVGEEAIGLKFTKEDHPNPSKTGC